MPSLEPYFSSLLISPFHPAPTHGCVNYGRESAGKLVKVDDNRFVSPDHGRRTLQNTFHEILTVLGFLVSLAIYVAERGYHWIGNELGEVSYAHFPGNDSPLHPNHGGHQLLFEQQEILSNYYCCGVSLPDYSISGWQMCVGLHSFLWRNQMYGAA